MSEYRNSNAFTSLLTLSAAGAGTTNSPDQFNEYARGAIFTFNVTVVSGTVSIVFNIQMKDPVSGQYVTIASTAAIATTSVVNLTIYPGIAATANVAISGVLPALFRVQAVNGTGVTPSVNATVGVSFIL